MITRIIIQNYRLFRFFDLKFTPDINILVGCNDAGKSTLIEAINLALTGRLNGRSFAQELSPYLVNREATREYVAALQAGGTPVPPEIIIDLFLEEREDTAELRGTNNLLAENTCGVRVQAKLSPEYSDEYQKFIADRQSVKLVPTEYYRVDWVGFSGNPVSPRSIPASASVIDSSTIRLAAGVDYHLQQIVRSHLDARERVELSRQYRSLREAFAQQESVRKLNRRLQSESNLLTDRELSLAFDISHSYTWENSVSAHVDDIPFQLIGRGEQNALKILLAIGRKASDAQVVLIEEPETHLAFSSLHRLMSRIESRCFGKQVVIATHSAYVLNKLGLDKLVLISGEDAVRISQLPKDTIEFFKKLPGFDTLRLVLAKGAILVEGPSDELIVQRAYLDVKGRLPMEDGIDVISIGLSHKRFLDIAVRLKRRVWIVTDNDGRPREQIEKRFAEYLKYSNVTLHVEEDPGLHTLEPSIVAVNDLGRLNAVLGTSFSSKEEAVKSMRDDKPAYALAIFESQSRIVMPKYIRDVVSG